MICLSSDEKIQNDLQDVVNLFSFKNQNEKEVSVEIKNERVYINKRLQNVDISNLPFKLYKRKVKLCLYKYLSKKYRKRLPWGSLTGIRPTKIVRDLLEKGENKENIQGIMKSEFSVVEKNSDLLLSIISNQDTIAKNNEKEVDFYVHIPICPSKCYYCSFPSTEIKYVSKILDSYVDCVEKEIKAMLEMCKTKQLGIKSIYFGGGTPSVLSAAQLGKLTDCFNECVPCEFVVECGRPDTIDEEKLATLKNNGVTRISINPQTFCESTLKRINRPHSVKQIRDAYGLAKKYQFDVNMDLICGLDGEKFKHFKNSLNQTILLQPDNITIHTLCVKRGSKLSQNNTLKRFDKTVSKMIKYSQKLLTKHGYLPYYLYRQKSQASNLENIGYSKPNHFCKFNIDTMEEISSIIASGAGAISKCFYLNENRIERHANCKGVEEYIKRNDEMIEKNLQLFENL